MDYLTEGDVMEQGASEELILDEEIAIAATEDNTGVAKKVDKGKGIAEEGKEDAVGDAVLSEDVAVDLEAFAQNSFVDSYVDDFDVYFASLFDIDDLFFSKFDVMKSEFAYLCDVLPNGYACRDDHFMHIFDINLVQIETFNLGTIENPKNILISSDLTPNEREKMKEILIKRQKVFSWSYVDMPGIDQEIVEYKIQT